jgi:MFS transporter, PPP family, 3-phenylpropionic acid transporter
MFAAYGVASPFLPAFIAERGVSAAELGVVLAAGTAIRLLSAPLAGRLGDRLQALRSVLVGCIALAAAITLGYLPAQGFWMFVALSLLQAAALAPMTVLADALSLGAAKRDRFEYGWVRGTGSAAFIIGTLLAGQLIGGFGLQAIIWMQAALLAVATVFALRVPELSHTDAPKRQQLAFLTLLRIPVFRNLVLVAALILGSHALHDGFAMIRWREAGISPGLASLLWSESVAAEVVVFFLIGPALVARLTPAGAIALAALAGMLRWAVMAQTTEVHWLALVQPLHGITFALLHLACMRLIARTAPDGLEGSAQALYGTVGIGGATAILTLASGSLYGQLGAQAFWVMGALCAAALPLTLRLRLK